MNYRKYLLQDFALKSKKNDATRISFENLKDAIERRGNEAKFYDATFTIMSALRANADGSNKYALEKGLEKYDFLVNFDLEHKAALELGIFEAGKTHGEEKSSKRINELEGYEKKYNDLVKDIKDISLYC